MTTDVSVLGAGAWGTALAKVLADKGNHVRLWTRDAAAARRINDTHSNPKLPDVRLPETLEATGDLEATLHQAPLVVLAVPSHALRATLGEAKPYLADGVRLVSATKGIESETSMLMLELVADVLGPAVRRRTAVLSGPSFANEVAQGSPTNIVIAADEHSFAIDHQKCFATERLRVYSSDDPIGVEVGGALKNVIAIAAGACDGLGFGHNSRAALITRGLVEIARVAQAKGGNLLSVSGLAGMGDLVLTCTGDLSRNRRVGMELGRGRTLDETLKSLGHVAEGVITARSAHQLAGRLDVELPICNEVYQVIYCNKSPLAAVQDLMTRPLKKEWI